MVHRLWRKYDLAAPLWCLHWRLQSELFRRDRREETFYPRLHIDRHFTCQPSLRRSRCHWLLEHGLHSQRRQRRNLLRAHRTPIAHERYGGQLSWLLLRSRPRSFQRRLAIVVQALRRSGVDETWHMERRLHVC